MFINNLFDPHGLHTRVILMMALYEAAVGLCLPGQCASKTLSTLSSLSLQHSWSGSHYFEVLKLIWCWCAGLVLLYLGAAVLVARLSSEATMMYYERHILYGKRFDRHAVHNHELISCTI